MTKLIAYAAATVALVIAAAVFWQIPVHAQKEAYFGSLAILGIANLLVLMMCLSFTSLTFTKYLMACVFFTMGVAALAMKIAPFAALVSASVALMVAALLVLGGIGYLFELVYRKATA